MVGVDGAVIDERGLNRALLARQRLLERSHAPLGEVVRGVGALQMQYWPALGPALWARVADLAPGEHHRAHETGELVTGTLLRGTIHTVPASDYPAYAVVTANSKAGSWRRTRDTPDPKVADLERALLAEAAEPRPFEHLASFVEAWVDANPGSLGEAEEAYQRQNRWRPFRSLPWFLRAPADGTWGPKTPTHLRAFPTGDSVSVSVSDRATPTADEALATITRRHLGAFGPAAVEDVASWINWNLTPVRRTLEAMAQAGEVVTFVDEAGRALYDLPDAPRPGPDVDAPVRLLPWFDSSLLAHARRWRTRILPERYADVVWARANGQLKPTFLVDGQVAGMWSLTAAKGIATLTLTPLEPVGAITRKTLVAEAEGLVRFCHPDARAHEVRFADDA